MQDIFDLEEKLLRDLDKIQEQKPIRLEGNHLGRVGLCIGILLGAAFYAGTFLSNEESAIESSEERAASSMDLLKRELGTDTALPDKVSPKTAVSFQYHSNVKSNAADTALPASDDAEDESLGAPAPVTNLAPANGGAKAPTPPVIGEEPTATQSTHGAEKEDAAKNGAESKTKAPIEQAKFIPPPTPAGGPGTADSPATSTGKEEKKSRKALTRGTRISKKTGPGEFTLQIRAFRDAEDATLFGEELNNNGYDAYVVKSEIPDKGMWYRVRIGEFNSLKEATDFQGLFEENESISTFVSPL